MSFMEKKTEGVSVDVTWGFRERASACAKNPLDFCSSAAFTIEASRMDVRRTTKDRGKSETSSSSGTRGVSCEPHGEVLTRHAVDLREQVLREEIAGVPSVLRHVDKEHALDGPHQRASLRGRSQAVRFDPVFEAGRS